jgi:hypothetical protein
MNEPYDTMPRALFLEICLDCFNDPPAEPEDDEPTPDPEETVCVDVTGFFLVDFTV